MAESKNATGGITQAASYKLDLRQEAEHVTVNQQQPGESVAGLREGAVSGHGDSYSTGTKSSGHGVLCAATKQYFNDMH